MDRSDACEAPGNSTSADTGQGPSTGDQQQHLSHIELLPQQMLINMYRQWHAESQSNAGGFQQCLAGRGMPENMQGYLQNPFKSQPHDPGQTRLKRQQHPASNALGGPDLGMNASSAQLAALFQQQQQGAHQSIASTLAAASLCPLSPSGMLPNGNMLNSLELGDLLKNLSYPQLDWNQSPNSPFNITQFLLQNNQFLTPPQSVLPPQTPMSNESCMTRSNPSLPGPSTPQQPQSQSATSSSSDSSPQNLPEGVAGMSPTVVIKQEIMDECYSRMKKQRKSKAKVTAIPGMPVVPRIRRRRRNGSIPEEDESPPPSKVSPPGCKQPLPPSPEEQQMNTPDDPVIHSPPSLRLSQAPGVHNPLQQMQGFMQQSHGNGLLMGNPTPMLPPSTPDSQLSEAEARARRTKCCRVCGDHATGYNFNVITCESCKAFFRRNALRSKMCEFQNDSLKCPYNNDCEINAVSRRFCQKCRLKKCFDVGMKKEWILNEEQLRRRKNSRLNNLKGSSNSGPSSVRSPSTNSMSPYSPPQSHISVAMARNAAIVDSVTSQIKSEAMKFGTYRSPVDHMTSPSSRSQPMSSALTSPTSTTAPGSISSRSPLSPRLSADALNQLKPFPLSEIVAAIQLQTSPNSVPLLSPSPTQTAKVVAYAYRLLNPVVQQNLQCTELIRIALPLTEYALLISTCANKQISELPNGDIPLPEECYEKLREMIGELVQKSLQRSAAAQRVVTTPVSAAAPPVAEQYGDQYSSDGYSPNMGQGGHDDFAHMVQDGNDNYSPNMAQANNDSYSPMGQVRTTSLLPHGPKYDDLSHYNMGPANINMDEMSPESRHRHFFIENAISSALSAPQEGIGAPAAPAALAPLIPPSTQNTAADPSGSGSNARQQQRQREEAAARPEEPKKNLQLNKIEMRELDMVRNAFACMDEPLHDHRAAEYLKKAEHQPSDIMNIMDVTIRRIVRTAKKLNHFQEISNDGKLQLLKSSMIDMLTIRGVSLLDEKMESWKTHILGQEASISCSMFDKLASPEQRTRFFTFCSTIHPILRTNRVAVMLIALVVLFDNSRATTLCDTDQEIVRRYHELYYHLLQRYVESVYDEQAPEMIKTIPVSLRRLARATEQSSTIFLNHVGIDDVAKLPQEFFKLDPAEDPEFQHDFFNRPS